MAEKLINYLWPLPCPIVLLLLQVRVSAGFSFAASLNSFSARVPYSLGQLYLQTGRYPAARLSQIIARIG